MIDSIKDEIDGYIENVALDYRIRRGVRIDRELHQSLGRVLYNSSVRSGDTDSVLSSLNADHVNHICDWLAVAVGANEPWLSRLDAHGRTVKLMKFGDVQQIVTEADKAMARRNTSAASTDATDGTETVHEFGDGWTMVRLLTPEALDHEGRAMRHCVGQGAYDYGLKRNSTRIFSLRDPSQKSHVTVEIDDFSDVIEQIKGKQNTFPIVDYMRRLLAWPGLRRLKVRPSELPPGFAAARNGGIVEFASMKSGDVFDGDLEITIPAGKGFDVFDLGIPSGVTIRGNVAVSGRLAVDPYRNEMLPRFVLASGVSFEGCLRLDHVLVDGLSLSATRLIVRNSTVRRMNDIDSKSTQFVASVFHPAALGNTRFGGTFEAQACRGIKFMADSNIRGEIRLAGCIVNNGAHHEAIIFDDRFHMRFGSHIDIHNCNVTFGSDFTTDGTIRITGSRVIKMPSTLVVEKDFTLSDSEIDRWSEIFRVKGKVDEDGITVLDESSRPWERQCRREDCSEIASRFFSRR